MKSPLATAMGSKALPPDPGETDTPDEEQADSDDGISPEFESAYDEWESNPSMKTMYAMIEACGASKSAPGLAIMLGKKR